MLVTALILQAVLSGETGDDSWIVSATIKPDPRVLGIASLNGELAQIARRSEDSKALVVFKGSKVSHEIKLSSNIYLAGRRSRGQPMLSSSRNPGLYELVESDLWPSDLNTAGYELRAYGDLMFFMFTGGTLIKDKNYRAVWTDKISHGDSIIGVGSSVYAHIRKGSLTRYQISVDSNDTKSLLLQFKEVGKHELRLAGSGAAVEESLLRIGVDTDFAGNIIAVVTMPEHVDLDVVTLTPFRDTETYKHEILVQIDPSTGLCTPIAKLAYRLIPNSYLGAGVTGDSIAVLDNGKIAIWHGDKILILERKRETTELADPS